MNLQNSTLINKEVYTKYQLFRRMYIRRSSFLNIFLYVLALILSAVIIYLGIIKDSVLLIMAGVLCLLFVIRDFLDKCIKPKKFFVKNKLAETKVNYIFTKNAFRIPQENDNADQSSIKYSQLMNVFETKDAFYLYVHKKLSYIVAKDGFNGKDAEKFAEHMKETLGRKYIVCR